MPYLFYDKESFDLPTWVIIQNGYLYMHPKLFGVLRQFITEYKHDRHLVG